MTPHQQVNMWFLSYAGQLAANGQYKTLLSFGFNRDQIRNLQSLSVTEMVDMVTCITASVIQAKVDPNAIDALFRIADRRRMERRIEMDLIKAGASQPLMHRLFGTNVHQYGVGRELFGIKGTDFGRRTAVAPAIADRVWALWHGGDMPCGEPEKYLAVHRETGLPVRDIEAIVREAGMADHGAFSHPKFDAEVSAQWI